METRPSFRVPGAFAVLIVACSHGGASTPGASGSSSASGGGASQPSGGSPASTAGQSSSGATGMADGGRLASGGVNGLGGSGAGTTAGTSASPSSGGLTSAVGGTTASSGNSGQSSSGGATNATTSGGETGAGAPSGSPARPPTEKALAKLPTTRQEHSVVAAAGEVYVIGGYAPSVTDSVQAYDPAKNSWRDVAPFPERLNHGNAGVVAEQIYVAGYYTNGGMSTATTKVYSYDAKTNQWTEKKPLPTGTQRAAACVAVDAGLLYVIGGAHQGRSVANAARYDAAADTWEELPPLPERREHCAAGALGGVIYVAGGRADGITGVQPKTWAFDPNTQLWTEKASLPPPRGGLAGAALGGRLFVFGGEGNQALTSGVFPDVDAYDPATNTWESMADPMLVPRHGMGAAALEGRIYVPGGAIRQGAGATDENSVFYVP